MSRRTKRHVTSRMAQAATIASSRSRGASGIVTSTMSGCEAFEQPGRGVRAADDADAAEAAAAQRRVVVDEADDPLARRLAQLAQQAAAGAAGADDQRRGAPSRSPRELEPADDRALGEARRRRSRASRSARR